MQSLLQLPIAILLQLLHLTFGMSTADSQFTNSTRQQYTISTTWDGELPADKAEIRLSFQKSSSAHPGLELEVDAPFYNDPIVPPSLPIGSTDKLWDYEVVEVFFLSESEKKYLEIELAPRGHYLLLQLDTGRNVLKYELPLENYTTTVNTGGEVPGRWQGRVTIPSEYFPKDVNKFNAYAIHKSDPERVYMSLFPAAKGKYDAPNFHRLNYFKDINLGAILTD